MKNFKKIIFALMVVFLVVGFIGCKTETDPKDSPAPVNNFIGTWMMDDLSTRCVITKDAFTTYVEGVGEFPGTYTLNKDNKSAVAKFTSGGGEEQTVDMALLEGETDVAEMDLSSFGLGESIFVKYREGEFDIVGTWSDGTLNIVITNEGYTVTAVADPTNTVSEGTVSKEGNTFTLVENESSDEVSTGVLSTNGKVYCNYSDPISGDCISAPFTKSN